jgi:hypothetical protein
MYLATPKLKTAGNRLFGIPIMQNPFSTLVSLTKMMINLMLQKTITNKQQPWVMLMLSTILQCSPKTTMRECWNISN